MVEDQNFHKVKKIIYVSILLLVFSSKSYSQNFKLEKLVKLKKETFIKIVLPLVVAENEKILNDKIKLRKIIPSLII